MSNGQGVATRVDDIAPDALLEHFKGTSLVKMVMATVLFHGVVVLGTSVPFLKTSLLGDDIATLTREQKLQKAVGEATSAMRKIAEANGLNPQDISNTFAPGGSRTTKAAGVVADAPGKEGEAAVAKSPTNAPVAVPEKVESKIEKDLKKTAEGPKMPGAAAKDDIF